MAALAVNAESSTHASSKPVSPPARAAAMAPSTRACHARCTGTRRETRNAAEFAPHSGHRRQVFETGSHVWQAADIVVALESFHVLSRLCHGPDTVPADRRSRQ